MSQFPVLSGNEAALANRRSFLRVGGMFLGGLALPQLLAAEQAAGRAKSQKAVIMIFLSGGPPHQDTGATKAAWLAGIRH